MKAFPHWGQGCRVRGLRTREFPPLPDLSIVECRMAQGGWILLEKTDTWVRQQVGRVCVQSDDARDTDNKALLVLDWQYAMLMTAKVVERDGEEREESVGRETYDEEEKRRSGGGINRCWRS